MENKKKSTPRQRALYPGDSKGYVRPQVTLSIKLNKDLYEWVKSLAGTNSFFSDVEETIVTSLRIMKRELKPLESGEGFEDIEPEKDHF